MQPMEEKKPSKKTTHSPEPQPKAHPIQKFLPTEKKALNIPLSFLNTGLPERMKNQTKHHGPTICWESHLPRKEPWMPPKNYLIPGEPT